VKLLAQVSGIETPDVEFSALLPLLVVLGGAVTLLVVGSLLPRRSRTPWHLVTTLVVAAGGIAVSVPLWFRVRDDGAISAVADAVRVDGLTLFFGVVILVGAGLASLLVEGYLRREHLEGSEAYVLVLLSAAGGMIMAGANDLIVVFIGLEVLSIPVYILAGYHVRRVRSGEAAMKYFVLGAFSSAFMLYGVALVYGATGSTNLTDIRSFLATNILTNDLMLLAGLALLLVGLGFKVAAVPFHSWVPDVYDGAPSPVVAFMASSVKVAGFAGITRVFVYGFSSYETNWQPIIYLVAVLTLVVGSVLAVVQTNVKRMLAYSSINHAGFVLIGIQAATEQGVQASLFYLGTYTFNMIGVFGVATVVGRRGDNAHELADYQGLAKRSPLLAFAFLVFLLAQAGVPPLSGFLAKFFAIGAAIDAGSFPLAVVGMVTAVISAFVYLRIVITMYGDDVEERAPTVTVPVGVRIAITIATVAIVVNGILPNGLNGAAGTAATSGLAPATAEPAPSAEPGPPPEGP
jgi:NADH-quinone oxidoreductase subunit N